MTGTPNPAVTWTAILGSITSSGVYTAPIVTSESQDTVSAISVADPSKYASGSVTITPVGLSGAAYSLNANSVTTKLLPSDVMSHCYGDTSNCAAGDAIAKCAVTDCGQWTDLSAPTAMGPFYKPSPGTDDLGNATYDSATTDPYYRLASAAGANGTKVTNVVFHAPNGASFSQGSSDEYITVWDQATGWGIQIYGSGGGSKTLPKASGCGSTIGTACLISGFTYASAATNLLTAIDYHYESKPPTSNGFGPLAATLREQELLNGAINHALMFNTDCVNDTTPYIFPSYNFPGLCGTPGFGPKSPNRPSSGTLLFLDYTPGQIASFRLPAWQSTLLTAMSTYGFYIAETGGKYIGLELGTDETSESSQPWTYAGFNPLTADPIWPWLLAQKGLDGTANLSHVGCAGANGTSLKVCEGYILANIPRTVGPEGTDSEGNSCTAGSGCYSTGHLHVADACIANAFANRAGGCS